MQHKDDAAFFEMIKRFNAMYGLDNHDQPTLQPAQRLENFKDILLEEVAEVDDIVAKLKPENLTPEQRIAVLAEIADWLGDMMVYCASEARRWGIPINKVLQIIMESNFSKLGLDGQPIYDDRGKVLKGPNYWRPEPRILETLSES